MQGSSLGLPDPEAHALSMKPQRGAEPGTGEKPRFDIVPFI